MRCEQSKAARFLSLLFRAHFGSEKMTEKLYYENQYIKEFTACAVSCVRAENGFEVVLDKTAFFPQGGGQPGDVGFIGEAKVIDTVEKNGEPVHICDREVSGTLNCRIDFEKRFLNMQQHTGEHVFSGILHSLTGFDNVGFHMGENAVTVDFNGAVTSETLKKAERLANEAIYKNIPVNTFYPPEEELNKYDYRSKKEIKDRVRLTQIEGVDLCACCGTHVAFTGEIGIIKVVSSMNYKSGVRITLQIGKKAFDDYCEKNESVAEISVMLKAKPNEITAAVERISVQLQQAKYDCTALKKELFAYKVKDLSGEKHVMFDDEASADNARILGDLLADRVKIAAAFSGNDKDGYKYAVVSRFEDVRGIGKELNLACSGRGGGKSDMVQGSVAATKAQIEEFFGKL